MKLINLWGSSLIFIALAAFISGKAVAADSELQAFSKKIQAQIASQNKQNEQQFKKITDMINSQVSALNKTVNSQIEKMNNTNNQERNKLQTILEGQIKQVKADIDKQLASLSTRINDLGKKVGSMKVAG
jgi:Skp family chaperone for outer membrane proteins